MTIPFDPSVKTFDQLILATVQQVADAGGWWVGMTDLWRDVTGHPDYPEYFGVSYRCFQRHVKELHYSGRLVHIMCSRNDARVYPKNLWDRMCGRAAEAR